MRSRYRIHEPDAAHFITCTIVEWLPVFTTSACCDVVIQSLLHCRQHRGLEIHAWVILDNHLHAILSGRDLAGTLHAFKRFHRHRPVGANPHRRPRMAAQPTGLLQSSAQDRRPTPSVAGGCALPVVIGERPAGVSILARLNKCRLFGVWGVFESDETPFVSPSHRRKFLHRNSYATLCGTGEGRILSSNCFIRQRIPRNLCRCCRRLGWSSSTSRPPPMQTAHWQLESANVIAPPTRSLLVSTNTGRWRRWTPR